MRDAIIDALELDDPEVVVSGFERPNLFLEVRLFHDEATKHQSLLDGIAELEGPGIVYVATRREAEELAEELSAAGRRVAPYHGGMAAGRRQEVQGAFMGDDLDAVVATVAFGMGIDKPNVRYVIHYEISDSVDSYYQEVGRAGRDGAPAVGRLLYRPEDLGIRRFFAAGGDVAEEDLEAVAELLAEKGALDAPALAEGTGLAEPAAERAAERLCESGTAERDDTGRYRLGRRETASGAAAEAVEAQSRQRHFDQSRIEMVRSYAESRGCRWRFVLSYFGQVGTDDCGHCDHCAAGHHSGEGGSEFPPGSAVHHREWGEGQVMDAEDDRLTVLFDQVGYKTLSLRLVAEGGLLQKR